MLYPKDSRVSVTKEADSIELKWNWFRKDRGVLLLNAVMFAGIGVIGLIVPDKPGQVTPPFAHFMFWFFLTVMVPGLVTNSSTWFVNKSVVHGTKETIRIHSSPFRRIKPIEFESEGITQFFVTQSRTNNGKNWTLYYLDRDSNYHVLGQFFASEVAAYQICHELQDFYGLEDLPVYGQNTQPHQPGPRNKQYE